MRSELRRAVLIGFVAAAALGHPAAAQVPANATSLEGTPAVRIEATADRATRRRLSEAEAAKNRLKIEIVDGRYYWAEQPGAPLTVSAAGAFTYLLSHEPGHYVRFRRLNDRLTYVEHLDTPSGSVTYWGELRVVLGK